MGRLRTYARRCLKGLKISVKTVVAAHLIMFGAAFASNNLGSYEQKTAVLASDAGKGGRCRHYLQSIGIAFGLYPYMTRYENAGGSQTEWFLHATSSDLENVVQDESFQNIVTVGHGGECVWYASDRPVWQHEVRHMTNHQKPGHWFQLTCGDLPGPLLGEYVVPDHNTQVYDGMGQNPLAIGIDAARGFPLLRDKENPDSPFHYVLLGRFIPEKYLRMLQM